MLIRNKKLQIAISEGLHKPKIFVYLEIVSKLTLVSSIACKRINGEFLRCNLDDIYIYSEFSILLLFF